MLIWDINIEKLMTYMQQFEEDKMSDKEEFKNK